jgi:hypothetical protein
MDLCAVPKKHARTVSRGDNSVAGGASMQEGSTLKVIRLTQLQACPKKIVPKLFEQTTYRLTEACDSLSGKYCTTFWQNLVYP